MKIGWQGRGEAKADDTPRGPWSDLPPPERKPRGRPIMVRRPAREPIIRNWRGLLIVLFLLIVAPFVARWASGVIMGLMAGR